MTRTTTHHELYAGGSNIHEGELDDKQIANDEISITNMTRFL